MIRILFVCLGNICRSPAAQAIAQAQIERRGLGDSIGVDSAGTASFRVGMPADPQILLAARSRGYTVDTRSKQLTERMVREHQWVIAMDRDNFRDIHAISRGDSGNVRLLSDYLGPNWPRDVPDPYRGPEQGFEFVLDMLEVACPIILDSVRAS